MWWKFVVSAFRKLKQEDHQFKAIVVYETDLKERSKLSIKDKNDSYHTYCIYFKVILNRLKGKDWFWVG